MKVNASHAPNAIEATQLRMMSARLSALVGGIGNAPIAARYFAIGDLLDFQPGIIARALASLPPAANMTRADAYHFSKRPVIEPVALLPDAQIACAKGFESRFHHAPFCW